MSGAQAVATIPRAAQGGDSVVKSNFAYWSHREVGAGPSSDYPSAGSLTGRRKLAFSSGTSQVARLSSSACADERWSARS